MKEVKIFNQIHQAQLIVEDNEWLLKNIRVGDFLIDELLVPDENGELPQKLDEFITFLNDNWDVIFKRGKDAVMFLKKDWFQSDFQPDFGLEYIVWEKADSVGSFRLHFYDGHSDTYGDWIVKFYFKSLRGVEREWI